MRVSDMLARLRQGVEPAARPAPGASAPPEAALQDRYVLSFPSPQNAIDLVPGWNQAFPPEIGVRAGSALLYEDGRIPWCIAQAGSVVGRTVLELGPLEGMHTYMLVKAGAEHVDAIEANSLAFMRCLISREVLGFGNASFRLGDFVKWMEQAGTRYDLVVASGVLYHSPEPLRLLDLIAGCADRFYVWTHYVDDRLLDPKDERGRAFTGRVDTPMFHGRAIALHERRYRDTWAAPTWCGGYEDRHYWLTRPGILDAIDALGFDTVTDHDYPDHVGGPCFSVFATRRPQAIA